MKEKILYHGTNERFSIIDTNLCSGYKDFGKGFYTTPRKEQAISWAKKGKIIKNLIKIFLIRNRLLMNKHKHIH